MDELKNYDRRENSLRYLSDLAREGAFEVGDYLLGRNQDFNHVQKLAGILGKYQLKDTDNFVTGPDFPYIPLWRVIRKNSDKDIRNYSQVALEMRLLRFELEDIPTKSNNLEELGSFLYDLSREFSIQAMHDYSRRLIA